MSSVRWHFFVFRNSVERLCGLWALSLVECVTVWALKLPVPHTDALKTHSSQSFSTELLESKGTGSEHLAQTNILFPFIFAIENCALTFGRFLVLLVQNNSFWSILPGWLHFHLTIRLFSHKSHNNCNLFY